MTHKWTQTQLIYVLIAFVLGCGALFEIGLPGLALAFGVCASLTLCVVMLRYLNGDYLHDSRW